ncbi:hypothetical protein [Fusibacter sp. JL216-2]|uniref:hypothetical protein n=1 Tax=Fusibacter sp. JL216-2 TaxID=3071453 RepID=UPI003D33047A
MIELKLSRVFEYFSIEQTQLNKTVVKALVRAMRKKNYAWISQSITFDEEVFYNTWGAFQIWLKYFDINYNRRTDFETLFLRLINSIYEKKEIHLCSLFCPGYKDRGYKDYLGHTTLWKLRALYLFKNDLSDYGINVKSSLFYADVFLENCDDTQYSQWYNELKYNRFLFHEEGMKFFDKDELLNTSDLMIFSSPKCIGGYVDSTLISRVRNKTYEVFIQNNKKFCNYSVTALRKSID